MNYPPANLWMVVQLDPRPEPEPELVNVTPSAWPPLLLPASWDEDRRRHLARTWEEGA